MDNLKKNNLRSVTESIPRKNQTIKYAQLFPDLSFMYPKETKKNYT